MAVCQPYRKVNALYDIQVAIVAGFHLFPFRTEKLSPFTPMVLRKWESRSLPSLREAFQFLKAEMLLFLYLLAIEHGSDLLSHLRSTLYLVLVCYANALHFIPLAGLPGQVTANGRYLHQVRSRCQCIIGVCPLLSPE